MKNSSFLKSVKCCINGIVQAVKSERNLKIQLVCAILAITLGVILKISAVEWAILVFAIMFVLFAELTNTAIENVVDLYTKDFNENAKLAKDIAAGAVLIASLNALIIGCIIFLDKIIILI